MVREKELKTYLPKFILFFCDTFGTGAHSYIPSAQYAACAGRSHIGRMKKIRDVGITQCPKNELNISGVYFRSHYLLLSLYGTNTIYLNSLSLSF